MMETKQQNPSVRSVGLFFFSGTGNTAVLMADLVAEFQHRGVCTSLAEIETFTLKNAMPDIGHCDLIGLGYPVHAFNAPRIVFDFVKLLPPGNGRRVFLLKCPGDHFANAGSTGPMRRALHRRGYDVVHEGLAVMPRQFCGPLSARFDQGTPCHRPPPSRGLCGGTAGRDAPVAEEYARGVPDDLSFALRTRRGQDASPAFLCPARLYRLRALRNPLSGGQHLNAGWAPAFRLEMPVLPSLRLSVSG
jgi:hypothetical protein